MLRKLSLVAVITALAGNLFSAGAQTSTLQITVSEGDGAFNNLRKRLGRDIRVEVRDESGQPVSDADVTFTAPAIGPSVSFGKSQNLFRIKTDAQGIASTSGLAPNNAEGRFNIRVTAESRGRSGAATLAQTNTSAGGIGASSGGGSKKALLIALLGGAAAGGVIFATKGGGSGSAGGPGATPAPVPIAISIGTVTVGGPR
ncbi:MAG: hypothetical protein SGI92_00645 [Bryobacteraceae bacterium]|nr:hypothetical protein [Bryobacteraceae bacterium]